MRSRFYYSTDRSKHMRSPEEIIAGAADLWACNFSDEIAERAILKLAEAGYVVVESPVSDENRFSLIMLNDSGVNLGIPLSFRGVMHAYTKDPKRRFDIRVEDGRAQVTEQFD
jgi:hypothetical protein